MTHSKKGSTLVQDMDNNRFTRLYPLWVYAQSAVFLILVSLSLPLFTVLPAWGARGMAVWSTVSMITLGVLGYLQGPAFFGSFAAHGITALRAVAAIALFSVHSVLPSTAYGFAGGPYQLSFAHGWILAALLALAETSDFFDGRIARSRGASSFGGVWDMECDALYALALSFVGWQLAGVPAFILILGMMRYVYFLIFRFTGDPPNHSRRFKRFAQTTTATLMIVLVFVFIPVLPAVVRGGLVAGALMLQLTSFGWDVALNVQQRYRRYE